MFVMNNVNYISDKTALLKCYYLASMHLPFYLLRAAFGLLLKNCALSGVSSFPSCNLITFTGQGKLIGGMRQLGQELGQGQNKSEVSLTALWLWRERSVNFNGRR